MSLHCHFEVSRVNNIELCITGPYFDLGVSRMSRDLEFEKSRVNFHGYITKKMGPATDFERSRTWRDINSSHRNLPVALY